MYIVLRSNWFFKYIRYWLIHSNQYWEERKNRKDKKNLHLIILPLKCKQVTRNLDRIVFRIPNLNRNGQRCSNAFTLTQIPTLCTAKTCNQPTGLIINNSMSDDVKKTHQERDQNKAVQTKIIRTSWDHLHCYSQQTSQERGEHCYVQHIMFLKLYDTCLNLWRSLV